MNLSEKSKIWKEASATFNQLNSDARGYGNNYVRDYAALERLAPKVRSIFVALEKYIWRLYRLMMSILSLLTTGDRRTYKKYRYDKVDTRKSMKEKLPEFFSEYNTICNLKTNFCLIQVRVLIITNCFAPSCAIILVLLKSELVMEILLSSL